MTSQSALPARRGNKPGSKNLLRKLNRSLIIFGTTAMVATICQAQPASPLPEGVLEVNVAHTPNQVNGQPAIVGNPTNPDNLVLVSTNHLPVSTSDISGLQCFVAYSEDRGESWSEVAWPYGDRPNCGDPYLAVDSAGTFFIAFNRLCGEDADCPPGPGQVGVARSADGGRTWSDPVDSSVPRSVTPRLRVDMATDHVYVVGGLGRPNDPMAVAVSTDHGITWGPGQPLPAQAFGNQIAVHDGVLATATALKIVDNTRIEPTEVTFWVSTDKGETFDSLRVSDSQGNPVAPPEGWLVPDGRTMNSDTLAMTDPIPLVSADPSHTGRFALMVPRDDNMEIYITDNAGKNWTGPTVIAAPDAARPWVEFGVDGNLGVMWRTFVDGMMDVYSTVSFNGGESFSQPLKVNQRAEPYTQIQTGGDEWSRIFLDSEYAYISWSDSRRGEQIDGIMARVPLNLYREGQ